METNEDVRKGIGELEKVIDVVPWHDLDEGPGKIYIGTCLKTFSTRTINVNNYIPCPKGDTYHGKVVYVLREAKK